ncbi:Cft2 family RNA processing exonuclease [Haloferula luteola]|uniref:Cft2 family RNA processing exonuclease n=1 Tax=Haloferula luteola TaxID=595692 RepID=A0A840UZI1_9BACT|nr:MBL fold metallo-hydrolase [Haloferula luteola]MBB5351155.1 Cft2 family RNA processing exonuclease [Haloferula luteola]
MRFRSLCRHAEIGSNSYVVEVDDARIVLDAGMHPKHEGGDALPRYDLLEEGSVDATVITHAHLDHIGSLPVLLDDQPNSRVFFSPAGADLGFAMLHNSVNVMQAKRTELGLTDYPFFGHTQLDEIERRIETRATERPFDLDADGHLRATFHDAGHVLGSVAVTVQSKDHTLLYTGDVNFESSTLIKGAYLPEGPVDTLVIETTRGDSPRPESYTREAEERRFADAIAETVARGGTVLVPVFAMGKTQEVLTMIHRFKQRGWIPSRAPVVIGGLSTKMTVIYDRYAKGLTRRHDDDFRILKDMDLRAGTRRRKAPIVPEPGAIFCLSSGMMTENTVSNGFARAGFLENPKNRLLFVGYADPDSPAGHIRAAQRDDLISLDPRHPAVRLRAEVDIFDFSGHATRDDLLAYILKVKPKRTFLVHGDRPASEWFRAQLRELLPSTEAIIPEPGQTYDLGA